VLVHAESKEKALEVVNSMGHIEMPMKNYYRQIKGLSGILADAAVIGINFGYVTADDIDMVEDLGPEYEAEKAKQRRIDLRRELSLLFSHLFKITLEQVWDNRTEEFMPALFHAKYDPQKIDKERQEIIDRLMKEGTIARAD